MTRNEVKNKCIEIWNSVDLEQEQKENQIAELLFEEEEKYSRSQVRNLLNQLEKEGLPVDIERVWNELRDKKRNN